MFSYESLDLLRLPVLLLDADGMVGHANTAAQELFALSARQLKGMPGPALFREDAELASRFPDAVAGRFGVLSQDTATRWPQPGQAVGLTLVPLEGQPWAALLEIHLLDLHGTSNRMRQLARELSTQRESLRNLAHEVKNPLGGIRGAAQLLQDELPEHGSLREYTAVIVAEVDRLGALIDRLMAPSSHPSRRVRFNIHEACERVHTLVSAEFAHQIKVERDYDASVPELLGDPAHIVQALLNLARNGAQALLEEPRTPDQPERLLTLRTRIAHGLKLATGPVRLGVVVSVVDNGPGVDPALRDRVFHPLVTGRAQGTGLGLSLAQELAQQHGGVIEFETRPGHTEFRLILPLEAA